MSNNPWDNIDAYLSESSALDPIISEMITETAEQKGRRLAKNKYQ